MLDLVTLSDCFMGLGVSALSKQFPLACTEQISVKSIPTAPVLPLVMVFLYVEFGEADFLSISTFSPC